MLYPRLYASSHDDVATAATIPMINVGVRRAYENLLLEPFEGVAVGTMCRKWYKASEANAAIM